MIEFCGVSAGYKGSPVLQDVRFTALPGQITTVLGQNGAGKTTLLKAVTGEVSLSAGKIFLDGVDIRTLSAQQLAQKVACLTQGKDVPDISAGRMVLHGRFPYLRYPRRYRQEDHDTARQAMEQVGILDLQDKPMAELSGGMRQKVYIAMALAQQTPVILMDEPTTYLDIGQQLKFAETARALAQSGKTVLLVLHDILLALRISERLLVLENGQLCAQGTPSQILSGGVLDRIYGIHIGSLATDAGMQYYYETR